MSETLASQGEALLPSLGKKKRRLSTASRFGVEAETARIFNAEQQRQQAKRIEKLKDEKRHSFFVFIWSQLLRHDRCVTVSVTVLNL